MADVSLFSDTNMAAATSRENTIKDGKILAFKKYLVP